MVHEDETKPEKPDASEVGRTVSQQAKQQPGNEQKDDGKHDEGTRPGDLSSENDGGSEG